MLNYLWAGMIGIGIMFAAFTGRVPELTNAALDSAKEAVTLSITMVGVMSFWSGFMEIAKKAGIIEMASEKLEPFLSFLFPSLPRKHPARQFIATNMIANILGLGWATTPTKLKTIEELEHLEEERRAGRAKGTSRKKGTASNEMCNLLIINISSLQLIPMTVIAYRSQYGSVNPTAIVGPGIVATAVSTLTAIIFCKIVDRSRRR